MHLRIKVQYIDYFPLAGPAHLVTNYPDIGHLAKWSVSSHKFGFGAECLRDDDADTFWHSDGPQPHFITVHFGKKVAIQKIAVNLCFDNDDSYTPATLCVRAGTGSSDLQDVRLVTFDKPNGWLLFDVYMEPAEEGDGYKPLHAYVLQVVVVSNHMNGKDTHVRGLKIFGPLEETHEDGDEPFPFKSQLFKMHERIR